MICEGKSDSVVRGLANGTEPPLVHRLVARQAAAKPDAPALISSHQWLSYGQLNQDANRLARRLRSAGAGPGSLVALCLPRSTALIVAALAALKAGAAYLPLDSGDPSERLIYMLEDSGAAVVITDFAVSDRVRYARCATLVLDEQWETIARLAPEDPEDQVTPDCLAYVIYTSGSTGRPKGVEITHANLWNLVSWHNQNFEISNADLASHLAGIGFDASVWETWPYLTAGASLRLADPDTLMSPEQLRDWLVACEITVSFVPTPLAERMLDLPWPAASKLRLLLIGGEALHLYPPPGLPFEVVNNYGPTECTVVSTSCAVPSRALASGLPPIGAPIANTQIYILDEQGKPVPPGQRGELHVGGASVGRGYRNHPELTAQRFVPNPFVPGTKLYKTGDLGWYLPDGLIAFAGRGDTQVKIRGYRIELDEIVAVMNRHPEVAGSAVVVASTADGQSQQLIAYVVAEASLSRSDLQGFLLERIPDYMVPSTFVRVESLPLTSRGKVDHQTLPAPDTDNILTDQPDLPLSPVEETLAGVVSALLEVPSLGMEDDFFLLGGHSLMATQLIARIRDAFGIDMPLRNVFERPTVRALAAEIDRLSVGKLKNMQDKADEVPDSPAKAHKLDSPPFAPAA